MNKKFLKTLSVALACVTVGACMASCGGKNDEDEDIGDKRVLKLEVLEGGIDQTAYKELAKAYMAKNPDVYIKIVANPEINSDVSSRLQNSKNLADIFSVRSIEAIKRWTVKDWVADINDVYSATLSTGKTVSETMTGKAETVCTYNGNRYAVPEYMAMEGYVYNKTLFDRYGWKIPETTAELETLCKKILADTNNQVAPIVYCHSADGYLYYATNNWDFQYSGISKLDSFYTYENAEVFSPENSQGKLLALQNLQKFYGSDSKYVMERSQSKDYIEAQTNLVLVEAAMMLNGSWFENEMKDVLADLPGEEFGMFAVPQMSDTSGTPLRYTGYTTEGNKRVIESGYGAYYFIPKAAANVADAKAFLTWLSEPEANVIYTKYTNGYRPFEYETDPAADVYSDMSAFGKSILTMASTHYLYVPNVTNQLAIEGKVDYWGNGGYPFLTVIGGGNPSDVIKELYNTVKQTYEANA